jgi:hypothetical protein
MRYAIRGTGPHMFSVVDRSYPLRPVLVTSRLLQALLLTTRLSWRSLWGW